MYANKIGCTVYERTVKNRMEKYIQHFISAIYWEDTVAQVQAGSSMKQQDSVLCIIPAASVSEYVPKKDDLLVCGRCDAETPPENARIIMTVRDFRHGSKDVQHLEVTAV